ncbi:glycoside hydrolase family 30 protein [Thermostilla marina]
MKGPAVLLLSLVAAVVAVHTAACAGETLEVRVEPRAVYQPIDGFGASDAWRIQFVGKYWPAEKQRRIADLLFSRETDAQGRPLGIGLSLWRFNLSAGTAEQGEASGIGNVWRRGECFLNPDGTYDWSKLEGQQRFLQLAKERGVERFLLFCNAPPVHLSANGKGYADPGTKRMNLPPDRFDDYARYIAEVLAYFARRRLPFDYVSPVNEPQWGWDEGRQEGTPATNADISALTRALSHELQARRLETKIVVGEAGSIEYLFKRMGPGGTSNERDDQAKAFFDPRSPYYLGSLPNVARILSGHSYFTVWPLERQVALRRALREALDAFRPPVGYWMSEYCILEKNDEITSGARRDLSMDTALYVARIIHNDLTVAGARSWQWWTAVTQCDYKDGLVYLDDGSRGDTGRMGPRVESLKRDGAVRTSKLLWTLGNYSRFVRPGMVRVGCEVSPAQSIENGVLASAYRRARPPETVVVLTNLSGKPHTVRLTGLVASPRAVPGVRLYTTDAARDLAPSEGRADAIELPPRSVVTVVYGMR